MLEVGVLYALNYVNDTTVIFCRFIGYERGFFLFKDEEGEVFPVRNSSATARRVYSGDEAIGRTYGESFTFEKGKIVKQNGNPV